MGLICHSMSFSNGIVDIFLCLFFNLFFVQLLNYYFVKFVLFLSLYFSILVLVVIIKMIFIFPLLIVAPFFLFKWWEHIQYNYVGFLAYRLHISPLMYWRIYIYIYTYIFWFPRGIFKTIFCFTYKTICWFSCKLTSSNAYSFTLFNLTCPPKNCSVSWGYF